MKLEWFGRYREISAALIQFSNCMIKTAATEWDIGDGVFLTGPEWQVLEVVVENEEKNLIMKDFGELLALPRSSVSKIAKKLLKYELIERYKFNDNQKAIILKPSQKGKDLYFRYVDSLIEPLWDTLFNGLSSVEDESLEKVATALRDFTRASLEKSGAEEKKVLIRI